MSWWFRGATKTLTNYNPLNGFFGVENCKNINNADYAWAAYDPNNGNKIMNNGAYIISKHNINDHRS